MANTALIESQIRSIETSIRVAQQQLIQARREGNTVRIRELEIYLVELDQSLATARSQLQQAQRDDQLGTASSGNLVRDDAIATVDRTQAPSAENLTFTNGRVQTAPTTTGGTNAVSSVSEENVDTGTNDPVRTLTNTQATPVERESSLLLDPELDNEEFGGVYGAGVTSPTTQIGVGSRNDDAGATNITRAEIDNIFTESQITPRPNVLDQYASYTYVASVYLVPADQYRSMIRTKQRNLSGSQLLFQSGGASANGRNPYFSTDYYIDKFEIKSFIVGKGTGLTHNAKEINMTVVEPNGITLIDNLTRAVQDFFPDRQKKKDITSVIYLMVVRFYGYDDQGNLVRGGVARPDGSSDPNAFVEKWFPFIIKDIQFKVANKLVEYEISAAAPQFQIAAGQARGTIPFNIELSGQTIKDLLSGPVQYAGSQTSVVAGGNGSTADRIRSLAGTYNYATGEFDTTTPTVAPAPPKANAATSNKTTIRQGLMAALNQHQQQLVDAGDIQFPDEYSIEFVGAGSGPSAIEQARLRPPGGLNKSSTSMSVPKTAADAKLGSKQSMDPNTRTQSATAGMQIVQFLDQVLRNSTYLKDQQLVDIDEKTGQLVYNGTPAQNVAWFKISLEAEPKLNQWDEKRNQFAYRIKYIVSPYRLSDLNSKYFPTPRFTGVQKEYKYWFTGENTSVLSYEENINGLYYLTLSGASINLAGNYLNQEGEQVKYNFQTNSVESSQGADGKVNEPVSNAAEYLFQPGALKEATVSIVGDPAWLQQGEASLGQSRNNWNFGSFLPDGTINFDSGQVLFRIAFNAPADYDSGTGIVRAGLASSVAPGPAQGSANGPAQINRTYITKEVISYFNKGRFTQTLKGALLMKQTTADNQAARALALNQQQQAVSLMSSTRQLSGTLLAGSLSTPGYLSTSVNNYFGALSPVANSPVNGYSLGSSPTRPVAIPSAPTSTGISVGLVNSSLVLPTKIVPGINSAITTTADGILSIGESRINGVVDDVSTGATQLMAASDDSGINNGSSFNFDSE